MQQQKDIIFRRIKGHIVPIKVKNKPSNYTKIMGGSAKYEFAAGFGVALGGGVASRFFRRVAKDKYVLAERGYKVLNKALKRKKTTVATKALRFVRKTTLGTKGALKIAKGLRIGTFAISSGLFAAGIQSIISSKVKEPSIQKEFAITSGAILSGTALMAVAGKYKIRRKTIKALQTGFKFLRTVKRI